MFMPMVWTNDFDDLMDDFDDYDPFDDMISLVDAEPTKDEVETAKSINRHARKVGRRYERALRHSYNRMNQMMNRHMNAMKTDVVDEGDHFTVKADLPGFDKKDIHIDLRNGILNIKAYHTEDNDQKNEKNEKYLRHERTETSYARAFNVGDTVKPEEIHAKYENGVLTLTIPHVTAAIEEEKDDAKKIEVQ